jgi:hypothetical protein
MVIKLSYSDVRNRRKLVRRDSQWRVAQKQLGREMVNWTKDFAWPLLAPLLVAIGWEVYRTSDFAFRISSASIRRRIRNLERRLSWNEDFNKFIGNLLGRLFFAILCTITAIGLIIGTMIISEMRCEVKVECWKLGYDIAYLEAFVFLGIAGWQMIQLRNASDTNVYREKLRTRIARLRDRLRE